MVHGNQKKNIYDIYNSSQQKEMKISHEISPWDGKSMSSSPNFISISTSQTEKLLGHILDVHRFHTSSTLW